jgi:heptosyltransferase-2
MVMAQSLFMTLRNRYPQAAIDVLAPQWSLPLLARMPEVRRGIALAAGHRELRLLERYRLGRSLHSQGYDWAIVLPRSLKAALVPYWARVPQRTGFRGEWRYGLLNDIRPMTADLDQTVKKFVALGLPRDSFVTCPQPKLTVDEKNRQRLLQQLQLDTGRPAVGIMPGAEYGPAKQWPPEYFAALIRELDARGVQTWIFGSQKDNAVAERIVQQAGGLGRNLCGRTQLADAVDLISAVSLAVSNDSGLMHIAAAVGRPLIALYGSTSPAYTPPLSKDAVIIYRNIECSPCFQRTCPYGHYRCLKEITVDHVLSAADRELHR